MSTFVAFRRKKISAAADKTPVYPRFISRRLTSFLNTLRLPFPPQHWICCVKSRTAGLFVAKSNGYRLAFSYFTSHQYLTLKTVFLWHSASWAFMICLLRLPSAPLAICTLLGSPTGLLSTASPGFHLKQLLTLILPSIIFHLRCHLHANDLSEFMRPST